MHPRKRAYVWAFASTCVAIYLVSSYIHTTYPPSSKAGAAHAHGAPTATALGTPPRSVTRGDGVSRRQANSKLKVEIWGKAAIGDYLWQHVFDADVEERMGGVWSYGTLQTSHVSYTYRTGPGVHPTKVPKTAPNGK